MLGAIIAALQARSDLQGWSVRHIATRGAQLYAVPATVEARRTVESERFVVKVVRHTPGPDAKPASGTGNVTLLPGDDIPSALDRAALMAGLVHNPLYSLPRPSEIPEVSLVDPLIQNDPGPALDGLLTRLRAAAATVPEVRLTAAELFGEEQVTRLCTSRGIDATQTGTTIDFECVLLSQSGGREAESFLEMSRRRVADVDIEAEVAHQARYALDSLSAGPPRHYEGPVVIQGPALATVLNGGVLQTLGAGGAKYAKVSSWEISQSIFRREAEGDPLTVFANRRLPYGIRANRFDDEGHPAQRVALIRNNILQTFVANQRYADYLNIVPTGAFGDVELPPGTTPAAELLVEPYVEIVAFSWFNPDSITGEFSSEIRFGYIHEGGRRMPFKGGSLVGNLLQALANVRWSSETGFYGDYQGPTTARFGSLAVAGEREG